jgi:hypothetical protein
MTAASSDASLAKIKERYEEYLAALGKIAPASSWAQLELGGQLYIVNQRLGAALEKARHACDAGSEGPIYVDAAVYYEMQAKVRELESSTRPLFEQSQHLRRVVNAHRRSLPRRLAKLLAAEAGADGPAHEELLVSLGAEIGLIEKLVAINACLEEAVLKLYPPTIESLQKVNKDFGVAAAARRGDPAAVAEVKAAREHSVAAVPAQRAEARGISPS